MHAECQRDNCCSPVIIQVEAESKEAGMAVMALTVQISSRMAREEGEEAGAEDSIEY